MNRGFVAYYSEGLKASAKTLYKNKHWLKYCIYLLMDYLARLTVLPAVLFDLIAVRQAQHVRDERNLRLCASFRAAEKGKSLGTMLLVRVMQVFMLLAGVAVAGAVGSLIGLLGSFIAQKANAAPFTVQLFFMIPPIALGVCTAIVLILFFAPSSYTVEKNYGFGMAGVIETSFDTMRSRGAFTHFMHHFVSLLVQVLFGGVIGFLYYFSTQSSGGVAIVLLIITILLSLLALVFAPLFTLAARVADYCLMEDISLDPSNRAKHAKDVRIARRPKNARDFGHDKQLLALFDADDADFASYDAEARRQSAREANDAFETFVREEEPAPASAPTPEPPTPEPENEDVTQESASEEDTATQETQEEAPSAEEPAAAEEPAENPKDRKSAASAKARRAAKESASESTNTSDTGDDL